MGALTINVKFTRTCRGLAQRNARLRNFNGIYVSYTYGRGCGTEQIHTNTTVCYGNSLSGSNIIKQVI